MAGASRIKSGPFKSSFTLTTAADGVPLRAFRNQRVAGTFISEDHAWKAAIDAARGYIDALVASMTNTEVTWLRSLCAGSDVPPEIDQHLVALGLAADADGALKATNAARQVVAAGVEYLTPVTNAIRSSVEARTP